MAIAAQRLLQKRDENADRYKDGGAIDDRQFVADMRALLAEFNARAVEIASADPVFAEEIGAVERREAA